MFSEENTPLDEIDVEQLDRALRPEKFEDFIGQKPLIDKLKVAIEAAKERSEPVPHCLIGGYSGGGKSTIAKIIANEYGGDCKTLVASAVRSKGDLLEALVKVKANSILFLDECHALRTQLQECLYSAMEDFKLTIKLGNNDISYIPIQPFCLIGATTSIGDLAEPFVNRFGIIHTMDEYADQELALIVQANAHKLDLKFDSDNLYLEIAKRARGCPRLVNRLLHRVRDYAQIHNSGTVTQDVINKSMDLEGVDEQGLTKNDYHYLRTLRNSFNLNPAGLNSIASTMGESKDTVEYSIEPMLLKHGFIVKTKTGRSLTAKGLEFIQGKTE